MNAAEIASPTNPPRHAAALNWSLAATALLSAWLLFQVQPMVAKRILPWFGGGTAVWTTVMLFFQSVLFLGYLYAHVTNRWFSAGRQVRLHVALLAAAAMLAAIVGVLPGDSWKPTDAYLPAVHILLMLAASVGLPYLMLSATAPLVQVWFAAANPGHSPYRLYALSNAGSLAALLSYPFLIEPNIGVAGQGAAWAGLFIAFALLCAWSGLASLRHERLPESAESAPSAEPSSPEPSDSISSERSRGLEYFFWLALPAVASVALLAITTYLCQDVVSIPLLWIAPMVVYLLSFILTFDSDRWYRRDVWFAVGAIASFVAAVTWNLRETLPLGTQLAINLTLLAAICMICHGELARQRPAARRLTSFYLSIAAGGALGGLFVAFVAPLLLADYYELYLVVLAAWVLALASIVLDRRSPYFDGGKGPVFASLLGMVVLLIGLGITMHARISAQQVGVVGQGRNFYGVLKVRVIKAESGDLYHALSNGRISHGAQFLADSNRRVPMWYYHVDSGIGRLLASNDPATPRRIGVIGLGAGTLAAYAEPNETFRFYEINPQVFAFAKEHFNYLEDARARGAKIELAQGDGRLLLEREEPQNFDVLVLDAFNSDSIPAHLLTLEALELYLRHLNPEGILALHITNEHLDLAPVVQAAAERLHLDATFLDTPPDNTPATAGSKWIFLSPRPGRFTEQNFGQPLKERLQGKPPVVWTDDYSSLLDVLAD